MAGGGVTRPDELEPRPWFVGTSGLDRRAEAKRSTTDEVTAQVMTACDGGAKVATVGPSREFFVQRPETVADLWARLIELRRTRVLADPPVRPYPFPEASDALRAIAQRQARGKIVLSTHDSSS